MLRTVFAMLVIFGLFAFFGAERAAPVAAAAGERAALLETLAGE